MFHFNKNALRNKIQHYKCLVNEIFLKQKKKEEDKKVEEAVIESMDASDPPAHCSKSTKDKVFH